MYAILTKKECSPQEFIDFWFSLYSYHLENLYLENISKARFATEDLRSLFEWKNGMRLSELKNSTLETKVLHKLSRVNDLKSVFSMEEFDRTFSKIGTIWKIFLLHCTQPHTYPMFDQHVFRAMQLIENNTISEVSKSERQKYSQYFNPYLPFFNGLVQRSDRDPVKVDRALWMFGKSLKLKFMRHVVGFA